MVLHNVHQGENCMWDWFSFIVGLIAGIITIFILLSIYAWWRIKDINEEFKKLGAIPTNKFFQKAIEEGRTKPLKVAQMGILKPQDKAKESKKKKKR